MSLVDRVSALATRVAQECSAIWSALAGKADTSALAAVALSGDFGDLAGLQDELDGKEEVGVAGAAVATHEAAVDPHPQYLTTTDAGTAYAPLSHTHSGTAITSGTVAFARLPVGTAASTVAAGDDSRFTNARTPLAHVHSGADITTGTVAYARLPVGTIAGTIAIGDHTHVGLGDGGGGYASGLIPSGSTTPTVEHGLGTQDLIVAVREVATGLVVRVPTESTDDNNLRFTFTTAPTLGQYRYTALSAAATLGTGAHTHDEDDIAGLAADLAGKADLSHTHAMSDVTGLADALDGKSDIGHDHGSTYLTPAQGDADYATIDHTHTLVELGAAAAVHTHVAADIASGTLALARIPTGTSGSTVALGNHTHGAAAPAAHAASHATGGGDAITPAAIGAAATSHVHAGADITTGTVAYARLPVGTAASTVAAGDDSRFTNARTPTAHAASHAAGQPDALTPAAIGAAATAHVHAGADITTGTVAFARLPTGTTGSTVAVGNDGRFSDARTPTSHAASHASGGGDPVTPAAIGAATSGHTHAQYLSGLVPFPPVAVSYAATIATDASLGNHFRVATFTGNPTLGNPTSPTDGQRAVWELPAGGSARTMTLGTKFEKLTGIDATLAIPSGKIAFLTAIYNATRDMWSVMGWDTT